MGRDASLATGKNISNPDVFSMLNPTGNLHRLYNAEIRTYFLKVAGRLIDAMWDERIVLLHRSRRKVRL